MRYENESRLYSIVRPMIVDLSSAVTRISVKALVPRNK